MALPEDLWFQSRKSILVSLLPSSSIRQSRTSQDQNIVVSRGEFVCTRSISSLYISAEEKIEFMKCRPPRNASWPRRKLITENIDQSTCEEILRQILLDHIALSCHGKKAFIPFIYCVAVYHISIWLQFLWPIYNFHFSTYCEFFFLSWTSCYANNIRNDCCFKISIHLYIISACPPLFRISIHNVAEPLDR